MMLLFDNGRLSTVSDILAAFPVSPSRPESLEQAAANIAESSRILIIVLLFIGI